MKSSHTLTLLAAFFAVGVWSRPRPPPDSLGRRMTMYYKGDVAAEVDPETDEKAKRMTMYYKGDVAAEVDPEAEAEDQA